MSYSPDHTDDDCDKCLKRVGKKNLFKVPFLYLDKNDKVHPDASPLIREQKRKEFQRAFEDPLFVDIAMQKFKVDDGYRQYYVCKECNEIELKRQNAK